MQVNKYFFAILLSFFIAIVITSLADAYRTKAWQTYFYDAHARTYPKIKVDEIHVKKIYDEQKTAEVLFIETAFSKGRPYQRGRLATIKLMDKEEGWRIINSTLLWDDRKTKGNKFTFPPYIGRDKTILLKR